MTELKITHMRHQTSTVQSFFMQPLGAEKEAFIPGQIAVLEMEGYKPSYLAFASAPEDPDYEFLVKYSEVDRAVANGLFALQSDAQVKLNQIVGRGFPVEKYHNHDLVLIGMGTGIAPLRSTLRHVFHNRHAYQKLIVLHGARTKDDFYFADEIEREWRRHDVWLRQVISRPDQDWSGATGYVQSLLDHIVPELTEPLALVCGSAEMINQTTARLQELGFSNEKILTNY